MIFNAYCACGAIANGTLGELLDLGWSGDLRECREHRFYEAPAYIPPPTVRVKTEPFPGWVADRDHWDDDRWTDTAGGPGQLELAA